MRSPHCPPPARPHLPPPSPRPTPRPPSAPTPRRCPPGGTAAPSSRAPATGALVDGGIEVQAERALTNVGAILAAAGLGWADVVKTTVLLADIADFKAVNEVYARHVTGPVLPARAAFAVAALPLGAGVEIEAVAVRP